MKVPSLQKKDDQCFVLATDKRRHMTFVALGCIIALGIGFGSGWFGGQAVYDCPPVHDRVDFSVELEDMGIAVYNNMDDGNLMESTNYEDYIVCGMEIYGLAYERDYLAYLRYQGFENESAMVEYFNTTSSDMQYNVQEIVWNVGSYVGRYEDDHGLNVTDGDPLDNTLHSFMVENRSIVITQIVVYVYNVTNGERVDISGIQIFDEPSIGDLALNNATGLWNIGESHHITLDRLNYYADEGMIGKARVNIDGESFTKDSASAF